MHLIMLFQIDRTCWPTFVPHSAAAFFFPWLVSSPDMGGMLVRCARLPKLWISPKVTHCRIAVPKFRETFANMQPEGNNVTRLTLKGGLQCSAMQVRQE